jgi:predicted nucleotidyltransferase
MNQKRLEYDLILSTLDNPLHGRAIAKALGSPLTTVQRSLASLSKANVLDHLTVGRNKLYKVKTNLAARQYVYAAEHHKLVQFLEKYPSLSPLFGELLEKTIARVVILYGSYARFATKPGSDIDIYVETTDTRPKKTLEQLDSRLSVKTGNFIKGDPIIEEIVRNHIILRGVEDYYERLGIFGRTETEGKALLRQPLSRDKRILSK